MNEGVRETKESPIEKALSSLESNIGSVKGTIVNFETILASVITEPEKLPLSEPQDTPSRQTSLESRLRSMSGDVSDINASLLSLQGRIQL